MRKSNIMILILLLLCGIGFFTNGVQSFLVMLFIFSIGVGIWTVLFYFLTHSKTNSNYQKAVNQSKKRQQPKKKRQKKKKSSFKVIDGGKK